MSSLLLKIVPLIAAFLLHYPSLGESNGTKEITDLSENKTLRQLSEEPDVQETADLYSSQLELKKAHLGYYFGYNDEVCVYIVLSPYVYKKFVFKETIDLEGFATPTIGLWGISEHTSLEVYLQKATYDTQEVEISTLSVQENGALYIESEDLHLEKVGLNFVPGLFHTLRSMDNEEDGYIASYDANGQISIQYDFPDNALIFDQEALDLTKLGYMYQQGKLFLDGKYGSITDQSLILDEDSIAMDKGMAFTLYQKAADMNYPPAMYNLATFYNEGIVVEEDKAMAVKWLTAAVNSGHTSSEELLGTLLYEGAQGVPKDQERAIDLWRSASQKGNAMAQYKLGTALFNLENPSLEAIQEGEFWLTAAAGRDVPEAFYDLYYINHIRSENDTNESYYAKLSMECLFQARYLGHTYASETIDALYKMILPQNTSQVESSERKSNEITISTSGSVYIAVKNVGEEDPFIFKNFAENESYTFERNGPVQVLFTEGSKLILEVGDEATLLRPKTNGKGKITLPLELEVETKVSDNEINTEKKDLSETIPSRENLIGHYFGSFTDTENDAGTNRSKKHFYIILMPHIYIQYEFNKEVTFEGFQNPIMGTWGIDSNKPWFIHLDNRELSSTYIFEDHLEILSNRNLRHIKSGAELKKTDENHVPGLFHTKRHIDGEGSTHFYERGKLYVKKAFSDGKEIYAKEGLDLHNMGVFFETGTSNRLGKNASSKTDETAEIDLETALSFYQSAAEKNYPPSMYNLAVFYEYGLGCEPDLKKAIKWYTAGAQTGHTGSLSKLAEIYLVGDEALQDNEKAVEYLLEAANNGDDRSQYYLGLCYFYDDYPLEKDSEKAEKWFRLSAAQGHSGAYYQLARVYVEKCGEEEQDSILAEEMMAYLYTAYDLGDSTAIEIIDGGE
jgi:TPR repeat protein